MPLFNAGKSLNRSWLAGTWRAALFRNTWTPDIDQTFLSGLVPGTYETTGTNYARKTLAGQTITVDMALDRSDHFADNLQWTTLTSSDLRYVVVYTFVTTDADSVLHSYFDLGAQSVTALDFLCKWNGAASNGVVFRGS